jgi:predicted deacylase
MAGPADDPVAWEAPTPPDAAAGRRRGRLAVDGLGRGLPVVRMERGSGPHLVVTAGVHGGEYCGIEGAHAFLAAIPPEGLHGTVTVLPLANPPAFYAKRQYVVPDDGVNLNRVFPGRADGSIAHRIAHAVMTVARSATHWVDLHSGDLHEALLPFVIYSPEGPPAVAAEARRMATAYGIPVLVESGAIGGGTYQAAAQAGIPAILPESGQFGQVDPVSVARHRDGLLNVSRTLGLVSGDPTVAPTTTYRQNTWVRSPIDALQRPALRVGEPVRAGQVGTVLLDEYGDIVDTIRVPHDGIILFHATSLAINRDDPLFAVIAP